MKTLFGYENFSIKSIVVLKLCQTYYPIDNTDTMSEEEQIEQLIVQTLDGAMSAIPAYMSEIEQNIEELRVGDVKEFVYGMIMGMTLGMASSAVAALRQGMPSEEDQIKIRDTIYAKIPMIRERIFS